MAPGEKSADIERVEPGGVAPFNRLALSGGKRREEITDDPDHIGILGGQGADRPVASSATSR